MLRCKTPVLRVWTCPCSSYTQQYEQKTSEVDISADYSLAGRHIHFLTEASLSKKLFSVSHWAEDRCISEAFTKLSSGTESLRLEFHWQEVSRRCLVYANCLLDFTVHLPTICRTEQFLMQSPSLIVTSESDESLMIQEKGLKSSTNIYKYWSIIPNICEDANEGVKNIQLFSTWF